MAYFENGSASELLDKTCQACPLGLSRCPVYLVQNLFNFDQVCDGMEVVMRCLHFLVDDKGNCHIKRLIEEQIPSACAVQSGQRSG